MVPWVEVDGLVIYNGDSLEVLSELEDNSVDGVVTDPPYGIGFMGKEWDKFKLGRRTRSQVVNMGAGMAFPSYEELRDYQVWCGVWAAECLRVLKPGGYLLAFGGARTYHRLACAIEDAGFEIRDMIEWIYTSGFPKSFNVGKALDKYLKTGNASWNGTGDDGLRPLGYNKLGILQGYKKRDYSNAEHPYNQVTEEEAKRWLGFGTALKPSHEPIVFARKPLAEKTIVENILKWGTSALDIDGCRIPTDEDLFVRGHDIPNGMFHYSFGATDWRVNKNGRFPSNTVVTDEALGEEDSRYFNIDIWAEKNGIILCPKPNKFEKNIGCENLDEKTTGHGNFHNSDGFERFDTKNKNFHPTVKPVKLISWLVKLISKEGDVILDPFLGSGTTLVACKLLNRKGIGIEIDQEYFEIAIRRIKGAKRLTGLGVDENQLSLFE